MIHIPFNIPTIVGVEDIYVRECIKNKKLSSEHKFYKKCRDILIEQFEPKEAFLTKSCTDSLEATSILFDIKEGDEVIMPSFTFVTTATAFVNRGARIKFVDIRSDTLNIDENLIESAITEKTKAIVPVHYAGVSCEMDKILKIARKYKLFVIEDAAQGLGSKYKGLDLGTIGDVGCFSFHETKNITAGDGGALFINRQNLVDRSQRITRKGTNSKDFYDKKTSKYSWKDLGSSTLLSDLHCAVLFPQLEKLSMINKIRKFSWQAYFDNLSHLSNHIQLPHIPDYCEHNSHIFHIRLKDEETRDELQRYLKAKGITSSFHFIPLHLSEAGKKFGIMDCDRNTVFESSRLLRLPLYHELSLEEVDYICDKVSEFFNG